MARLIDGNEKNIVGHRVRVLRKKKKMTQEMLSIKLETEAVYICRASMSRLEAKQRTVTDIELLGIAKILGTSVQELFPND